jgi:hypothetical protein
MPRCVVAFACELGAVLDLSDGQAESLGDLGGRHALVAQYLDARAALIRAHRRVVSGGESVLGFA